MEIIGRDQAIRLMAASGDSPTGLRNRTALALLYWGGLRPSEVVAVRVGDFDAEAGELHQVGTPPRMVPLLPSGQEAVRRWLVHHPAGHDQGAPLVATLDGGPISESYLRQMVSRTARDAGLDARKISPRVLRDSAGVELAHRAGLTAAEIADFLGLADRRSAEKFVEIARADAATRMQARELQPQLPERPDAREVLGELLGDARGRRDLARALVAELGEEIAAAMAELATSAEPEALP